MLAAEFRFLIMRGSNSGSVEGALAHSLSSLDQKSPVDESIHGSGS